MGWWLHSSKLLHEVQWDRWGTDNGNFAFSAAGSAQLEFSSPGVPKSTLGPTSLPSVSTEKAACSGYRGCQNKTTAWVAAKKTCTSWHFSLGLVIRPPPKHGFSSPIVSMINASQEKVCWVTIQQDLLKIRIQNTCFTSITIVLVSSVFFSPIIFL